MALMHVYGTGLLNAIKNTIDLISVDLSANRYHIPDLDHRRAINKNFKSSRETDVGVTQTAAESKWTIMYYARSDIGPAEGMPKNVVQVCTKEQTEAPFEATVRSMAWIYQSFSIKFVSNEPLYTDTILEEFLTNIRLWEKFTTTITVDGAAHIFNSKLNFTSVTTEDKVQEDSETGSLYVVGMDVEIRSPIFSATSQQYATVDKVIFNLFAGGDPWTPAQDFLNSTTLEFKFEKQDGVVTYTEGSGG